MSELIIFIYSFHLFDLKNEHLNHLCLGYLLLPVTTPNMHICIFIDIDNCCNLSWLQNSCLYQAHVVVMHQHLHHWRVTAKCHMRAQGKYSLVTNLTTPSTVSSHRCYPVKVFSSPKLSFSPSLSAQCPRSQLTGGGRREGGRWAEQWECGAGIVGENLGWSHSVWSAPPLPSSSFCSAAKAISTSY